MLAWLAGVGLSWGVHISEMGHAETASLGLEGCAPGRWGTVLWGTPAAAPEALWPPSITISSPSMLLPAGLPALAANDPEGELGWTPSRAHPQILPRDPCLPAGFMPWLHVHFSFLTDKNSPFYYGESSLHSLPSPTLPSHLILCQVPHTGWGEGLMRVKQGEDRKGLGRDIAQWTQRIRERVPAWSSGRYSSGKVDTHRKAGQFTRRCCYGSNQPLEKA